MATPAQTTAPASGTLFLLVGPSGAGKDTLLDGARARLEPGGDHVFPAREITRPEAAGGECHVAVDEETFASRVAGGAYALHWRAHGLGYGVPMGLCLELLRGRHVVVNASRSVLDEARRRFPSLRVVHVTAPPATLRARIEARGREAGEDVEARVARAADWSVDGRDVVEVRNDGSVEEGIERLVVALSPPPARGADAASGVRQALR